MPVNRMITMIDKTNKTKVITRTNCKVDDGLPESLISPADPCETE